MSARRAATSRFHLERTEIERAVQVLRRGGVVAIPTDTVYGIAAALDQDCAIERIFAIKGRDAAKALPILVSDVQQLSRFARTIPTAASQLAACFWPGALTIVVDAHECVPASVLRGGTTVGLRMPASDDALAIIERMGGALVVTSANRSGEPEARTAGEVRLALGDDIDLIVDGGPSPGGQASTVVDCTGGAIRILRAGAIDPGDIVAAIGGLNKQ